MSEAGQMRQFPGGATRSSAVGKPDYLGYNSALVDHRFGEYMLKHQVQADGQTRAADNWKREMPGADAIHSLVRHVHDLTVFIEGGSVINAETGKPWDIEDLACAIRFNIQVFLLDCLRQRRYLGVGTVATEDGPA